jgi:hypothetical protein
MRPECGWAPTPITRYLFEADGRSVDPIQTFNADVAKACFAHPGSAIGVRSVGFPPDHAARHMSAMVQTSAPKTKHNKKSGK